MFLGPEKGVLPSLTLQLTLLIHGLSVIRFLHHEKELVSLTLHFTLYLHWHFCGTPCSTEEHNCTWPYSWPCIYMDIPWCNLYHRRALVSLTLHLTLYLETFCAHLATQKGIGVLDLTIDLAFTWTFCDTPCTTEEHWCPWPYIWPCIYMDILWHVLHQRRALVSLTLHLTLHKFTNTFCDTLCTTEGHLCQFL